MASFVPFVKMNGLGNEIIVADMRGRDVKMTSQAAIELARHPDTVFDQIMAVYSPIMDTTDYYIEIWNRDGTLAQACGNGTRCVVNWLYDNSGQSEFVLETAGGIVDSLRLPNGLVRVNMGQPHLDWQSIPVSREIVDTNHVDLQCGPLKDPSLVSMGNPHAIFFVNDALETFDLARLGSTLERDPLFPQGCNISIAKVLNDRIIAIRTWERGAGLTKACGTAACAAAVAAVRRKLTKRAISVRLPEGILEIEWQEGGTVIMTGPTEYEFSGTLNPETGDFNRDT